MNLIQSFLGIKEYLKDIRKKRRVLVWLGIKNGSLKGSLSANETINNSGSRKRKKEMYGSLAVNRKIEEHSLARIKCKKSMKESIVEEIHCCKHLKKKKGQFSKDTKMNLQERNRSLGKGIGREVRLANYHTNLSFVVIKQSVYNKYIDKIRWSQLLDPMILNTIFLFERRPFTLSR